MFSCRSLSEGDDVRDQQGNREIFALFRHITGRHQEETAKRETGFALRRKGAIGKNF
jgi:hypothetical protein